MPFTSKPSTSKIWIGAAVLVALGLGAGVGGIAWSQSSQRTAVAHALTGGDPERAPELMRRYGCGGCHTIAGVPGADGLIGGPLDGLRERVYIGGVVQNNANNLINWIVSPRTFSPRTAMPATGISADEARDVAAYLYAQRSR
jgi:cytochrome c2